MQPQARTPARSEEIYMRFDFDRFEITAKLAYRRVGDDRFSFDEVLNVFSYYFSTYELIFETPHPMISLNQTASIIEKMPYTPDDAENGIYGETLTPEQYPPMIDQHFATDYRNCDFNINHFFSGLIRNYRNAETRR